MMKIVSWNVNGLKAVVKNRQTSLKGFLDHFDADIVCIQETKATRSMIGIDIAICEGYTGYFSFSKVKQGYSGVATFCRMGVSPIAAEEGITGHAPHSSNDAIRCPVTLAYLTDEESTALDSEGRAILTEHVGEKGERVVIINVYCPRVDPESPERLPYKLNFFNAIEERCRRLVDAGKHVIVCGDFNCTRLVIDSAAAMEKMPTFRRETETRELLSRFVGTGVADGSKKTDLILLDSFRIVHPSERGAYTCWCTMTDSRKLNYGQRIDYVFVSLSLQESLLDSQVLQEELGSDHCPVMCQLGLILTSSDRIPSLSSHHFPEFTGRQSKLSAYFGKVPVKRPLEQSTSSSSKKMKNGGQTTMSSLWNPKQQNNKIPIQSTDKTPVTMKNSKSTAGKLSTEWKGLFKPPPKAPLCSKHKQPAVLRTVKKNGPNKNRKFYVCSKPDGAKSDPQSRCDFFQWVKL